MIPENLLSPIAVPAKTILLREGETCRKMFFIRQGSIRIWFNGDGKDITTQFFFPGDAAASLESFLYNEPSRFTIEAIEACELAVFLKEDFDRLIVHDERFKTWFYETALQKMLSHSRRLLSHIRNKPEERYRELLSENPELLKKVPQQYLASYLGITPVSLSRIKNRNKQ